ncbi:MAG: hypothetical protein ABW003_13120 [Microvirga sp.]
MASFFDSYLITGMGLFGVLAVLGEHPDRPRFEPIAYYTTDVVEIGIVRGTVQHTTADDCLAEAKLVFRSRTSEDMITLAEDLPANGIDAPYVYGCQMVDPKGTYREFRR